MTVKQVEFYDGENQECHSGILIDNDYIICGCCGGVFEVEDWTNIIYIHDDWTNIENTIHEGGGVF